MKRDSLASTMNWSKNLYVFMLGALIVFSGCFGTGTSNGDDTDDDNDSESNWVNDRGLGNETWFLVLNDNQWLEIKSAAGIIVYAEGINIDPAQTSMVVTEETDWFIGNSGYSPIFGGNYSMCKMWIEGQCYNEDPEDGDWELREWSIIYRIHDV